MPIRLLTTCVLLSAACPAFAQYHAYGNGHGVAVYDSYVVPYYDDHYNHGHGLDSHGGYYGHDAWQDFGGYDHGSLSGRQTFGCSGDLGRCQTPIRGLNTCAESLGCPFQSGATGLGPRGLPYGDQPRPGSGQLHEGHSHDHAGDGHNHSHGHAHESPAASPARQREFGRLRELPRIERSPGGQVTPHSSSPSDRQPLAPPALPPSGPTRPEFDAPLGDGPPPPTVPLTAPRSSVRSSESRSLNI